MSAHSRSICRPILWLGCSFAVVLLCFWYPLWLDGRIPQEFDSRIWMIMPAFMPYIVAASLIAAIAYFFLWRAVFQNRTTRGALLLALGTLMVLAAVLPGVRIVAVFISLLSHSAGP
jgi:hypothetical protein